MAERRWEAITGIAGTVLRFLMAAIFALAGCGAVLAQEADNAAGSDLLRYLFKAPLGEDIVQAIETGTYLRVGEDDLVIRWSHEVVLRMQEHEPPDILRGTFQLRNVINLQNADRDLYYLIAKAIEGQTYPLEMADFGIAVETDWPGMQARITERLPGLTDAMTASSIRAALPLFADGTVAALRPVNTLGLAYVLGFRRDGEIHSRTDVGPLSYFGVENAVVHTTGGLGEEEGDLVINWLVEPDPQAATAKLGTELRALARTADAQLGTESSSIIDTALAEGLVAGEEGHAIYDLEPGLMREIEFTAWITTEMVERFIRYKMMRLAP